MNDYMKTIINALKEWIPVKSVNGQTGDVVLESTQADWGQNDISKQDYIKNRTHYDDTKFTEFLKITYFEASDNVYFGDLYHPIDFLAKQTFANDSGVGTNRFEESELTITFPDQERLTFFRETENSVSVHYYYSFGLRGTNTIWIVNSYIKTLDEKFIPDSIARKTDILTSTSQLNNDSGFITANDIPSTPDGLPLPPTAAVGQYFKVSAVDENGNVTAVEAVDAPSGGGEWVKLNEFSLEENALTVLFDADADGNPFSLKKLRIFMYLPKCKNTSGADATTGYACFKINDWSPAYQNPSSGWDDSNFVWTFEAVGDYITVRCLRGVYNRAGIGNDLSIWHTYKSDKFNGVITSFLWSIFSPTADKPSAMAGATFEVWGVRA